MTRAWKLDDCHQTLVLAGSDERLPEAVYWGPPLPAEKDLAPVAAAARSDLTGGMLDAFAPLSIFPTRRRAFKANQG